MPDLKENAWFTKLAAAVHKIKPQDKRVEGALEKVRRAREEALESVATAIASEKQLLNNIAKKMEIVKTWESRAQQAKINGNQALAQQALLRKAMYVETIQELHSELPVMRQQNIQLTARLQGFNVVVHRLLILKDLLDAMPVRDGLQNSLVVLLKEISDRFPSFSSIDDKLLQDFSNLIIVTDQRLAKLEEQVAVRAISVNADGGQDAARMKQVAKSCIDSTRHTLEKLELDLAKWKEAEIKADAEKNEDAYWKARQFYWTTEKSVEFLRRSLSTISKISEVSS